MLAYVMEGAGRGGLREVPDPVGGDYDVVVEMLTCGVCSSTDKMLRAGTFTLGVTYPSILGHESVGRVVDVGAAVRNFGVGDLVTRPSAYRPSDSPLAMFWGGFAQRGTVTDWAALAEDGQPDASRRDDQVRLPAATDPEVAALSISLSETFSVAAHHDLVGKTVAVVGTGVAGLSFVAHAKLLGAAHVLVVGRRQERVDLAASVGADSGALPGTAAEAAACLGGVDLVFEASGQAEMIAASYRWLKNGGQSVVYSAPEALTQFDLFASPRDAALTVASTQEAAVLPSVIKLISGGVYDPATYITSRYPFADIDDAFADISRGDVVKALISFT